MDDQVSRIETNERFQVTKGGLVTLSVIVNDLSFDFVCKIMKCTYTQGNLSHFYGIFPMNAIFLSRLNIMLSLRNYFDSVIAVTKSLVRLTCKMFISFIHMLFKHTQTHTHMHFQMFKYTNLHINPTPG